jgi:hypothetical protein
MQKIAQLKGWLVFILISLLVVLVVVWVDSYFHERHFIFLPGGDVGLGFATDRGKLYWVEYAPWSPDPQTVYWPKASISFPLLTAIIAMPLFCYLFCRHRNKA